MAPRISIPIDKNWQFKQADKKGSEFFPVAQFPTNVHLDLVHNNLIPDPFIGKNEDKVQWVGEAQWTYRTTFTADAVPQGSKAVLVFDGLDTFATVFLNGSTILESDNMFVANRVDVTSALQVVNELVITFDSAYLRGWKLVEQYPNHKWIAMNGDSSRLPVRKAQYHWGWDWGPTLITCGPWKPIHLDVYQARISDVWAHTTVQPSLKTAEVVVHVEVEGQADTIRLDISLHGKPVTTETVDATAGGVDVTFYIPKPSLWYPIRYGKQPLYLIAATAMRQGRPLDTMTKKIGLRRAEVIQRCVAEQPGTSFFFQVNNIPLFCGGSNWIPADNFLPRISKEQYRDWVKLIADGNQYMVRVWGGGIYESPHFYDACDELGILVWQDFMFACGNYPTYPDFLASIEREAVAIVKLLRHHPSIVLWAGNNEDYQVAEGVGLTYDYENKDADSWLQTDFPARYIYEKILPDVCAAHAPAVFYHPGSPWGAGRPTSDPTVGDLHQWNVWHGSQEKYQNFDKLVGRFVSEFGMQAFPSLETMDACLPQGRADLDRYAQSSTVDFHNKADGHERRIALYLAENMRYAPDPLAHFVYSTQLMQAECLASAYRLWKRQWRGPGREYCGGALVWQMNDCWPATSWSMVDYYLRPKMAYFSVRREMAPVSVGIARRTFRHPRDKHTRAHVAVQTQVEVWGTNLMREDVTIACVLKAWDVETGDETFTATVTDRLVLPENRSTEIVVHNVPVRQTGVGEEERTVVAAYLVRVSDGQQLARHVNWPEPLKYLHLQTPQALTAELVLDEGVVKLSAEVPVKGVALACEDEGVRFHDNLVDLVPGEVVRIGVQGATQETKLVRRYLGMLD